MEDMGTPPLLRYTVAEYLTMDEIADHKSEFHDGEVFPVVDASEAHAILTVNAGAALVRALKPGCVAQAAPRIQASASRYVYPDVAVVCGKSEYAANSLTNPKLIVEVLSPSTADYDSGGKFKLYQLLPSFEEYLLIAQDRPRVDYFRRVSPGHWSLQIAEGLDASLELAIADTPLLLSELYANVTFEPLDEEAPAL